MHVVVIYVDADDASQWHSLIAFQSRNVRSLFFNLCTPHPLLSISCSCFSIHLFYSIDRLMTTVSVKKAADKWREKFSTESEMLSHLFTHSCLTHWKKNTDFLQPLKSAIMLVIDSLVLIIMQNVSECFTYSEWHHCDLLKYCEIWHWMSHMKR